MVFFLKFQKQSMYDTGGLEFQDQVMPFYPRKYAIINSHENVWMTLNHPWIWNIRLLKHIALYNQV